MTQTRHLLKYSESKDRLSDSSHLRRFWDLLWNFRPDMWLTHTKNWSNFKVLICTSSIRSQTSVPAFNVHFLSFSSKTGKTQPNASLNSCGRTSFVGYILFWLGPCKSGESQKLFVVGAFCARVEQVFSSGPWSLDSITSCVLALWRCGQGNHIFSTIHLLSSAIYVSFCGRFCHHRSYFPFTASDLKGHRFCFSLVIQGSVRFVSEKKPGATVDQQSQEKSYSHLGLCLLI